MPESSTKEIRRKLRMSWGLAAAGSTLFLGSQTGHWGEDGAVQADQPAGPESIRMSEPAAAEAPEGIDLSTREGAEYLGTVLITMAFPGMCAYVLSLSDERRRREEAGTDPAAPA